MNPMQPFQPFRFARLYFKGGGGDNDIKDTEDQKALAEIAAQRWQQYQQNYIPVENRYMDKIRNFDSPETMNRMTGIAATNTENAFSEALNNDIRRITAEGINPGSGTFKSAITDNATAKNVAMVDNTSRTQQAVQDTKVQGMQNIVNLGSGLSTEAITGLGETAASSAYEAERQATRRYNNRSANRYAMGTAAGMATRSAINDERETV